MKNVIGQGAEHGLNPVAKLEMNRIKAKNWKLLSKKDIYDLGEYHNTKCGGVLVFIERQDKNIKGLLFYPNNVGNWRLKESYIFSPEDKKEIINLV